MKLILKNKQEIEIANMNNAFSFGNFKDGKGNQLNYDSIITMFAGENESFDAIKEKLADGNDTGFVLAAGKTKRNFPGWKVDTITEDLSDKGSSVAIKLGRI